MRIRHILFLAVCFLLVIAFAFPSETSKTKPDQSSDTTIDAYIITDPTATGYPGTLSTAQNGEIPRSIKKKSNLHFKASDDGNPIGGTTTILSMELRKIDPTGTNQNTLLASFPAQTINGKKIEGFKTVQIQDPIDQGGLKKYYVISFADLPEEKLPASYSLAIKTEGHTDYQTGQAPTISVSDQQKQLTTGNPVHPKTGLLDQPVFTQKNATYSYVITVYRDDAPELQTHNNQIISKYNNHDLTKGVSNHPDYIKNAHL